jgi:hypothetical protein
MPLRPVTTARTQGMNLLKDKKLRNKIKEKRRKRKKAQE